MTWIYRNDAAVGPAHETLRFVWKDSAQPVYLMDNHRAASWCWAQHLKPEDQYNFIHIDTHWDVGTLADVDLAATQRSGFWQRDLATVMGERSQVTSRFIESVPGALICYDNYIAPFMVSYPNVVKCLLHARQPAGIGQERSLHDNVELFVSFDDFAGAVLACKERFIVNIDIDYAFSDNDDDDESDWGQMRRVVSNDFIRCGFGKVKEFLAEGRVLAVTIALSPEFCGGDKDAFDIWALACEILGIYNPLSCAGDKLCLEP